MSTLQLKMTDYDHVKEFARISYINSKGAIASIFIHRETFRKLMIDAKDPDLDPVSTEQYELRDAVNTVVKKDFLKWFDESANTIMETKTNA